MTYLMAHQHIIYFITNIPDRKSQNSIPDIERCSFNILMFYHQVFGGKEFSEIGFDSLVHRTSLGMWL